MLTQPLRTATIAATLFVAACNATAAPCQATRYEPSFRKDQPIVAADELIKADGPIIPGGKVVCTVEFDFRTMQNVADRIETGSLNGKEYRFYYSDGSGLVQGLPTSKLNSSAPYANNWSLRCDKDAMSDTHSCSFSRADLTIGTSNNGGHSVTVGYRHYPNSNVGVRVDKNPAVIAPAVNGFSPQQQAELMQQLLSGRAVLTRNVEEPSPMNVDKTMVLFGFAEATQIVDALNAAALP